MRKTTDEIRAYTLYKEIKSKEKELDEIRNRLLDAGYKAGDVIHESTRNKERLILGSNISRGVNSDRVEQLAKVDKDLTDILKVKALESLYKMTVGDVEKLLVDFPELATALYTRERRPPLTVKASNQ